MGACYDVTLSINVTDEAAAVKALSEKLHSDTENGRARYAVDRCAEKGIALNTLDGLISVLLAGDQSDVQIWDVGEFRHYENAFDASYGWERVMVEWFHILTPFLGNGSKMLIYPDSDYDEFVIRDGQCVQLH